MTTPKRKTVEEYLGEIGIFEAFSRNCDCAKCEQAKVVFTLRRMVVEMKGALETMAESKNDGNAEGWFGTESFNCLKRCEDLINE